MKEPKPLTTQSRRTQPAPAASPLAPEVGVSPRRFVIVFALCLLLGFALLRAPFVRPAVMRGSIALVDGSAALIRFCGGKVRTEGAILRSSTTGFAVEMKDGCNGVNVMVLLCSAVLAFPASWTWKAKGLLVGVVAIQALNFVRFISLFYLGQYSMAWFDFAHAYLWESLIMLDAMAIFWLWVHLVFRSVGTPSAVH